MGLLENVCYFFLFFYEILTEIYHKNIIARKIDQSGKVFVITGGNTGLGKETARQIGLMNPKKIYITSRNEERGRKAIKELQESTGLSCFECIPLDLESFTSVDKAATLLKEKEKTIDVLILNAGVGNYKPGSKTVDGYDSILSPNLKAASKKGEPARVVVLSSLAHFMATEHSLTKMESGDINTAQQYGNTKMMNILFVKYLNKRHSPDIIFNAVHPGTVDTEFLWKFPKMVQLLFRPAFQTVLRDVQHGASTTVHVATSLEAGKISGEYWSNMMVKRPHFVATEKKGLHVAHLNQLTECDARGCPLLGFLAKRPIDWNTLALRLSEFVTFMHLWLSRWQTSTGVDHQRTHLEFIFFWEGQQQQCMLEPQLSCTCQEGWPRMESCILVAKD
ncbi:hypothetical protein PROFUN_02639 [Planoprotostelium fungivorum]|uniref:Uncharacterized protein n=1 Tax=Planoprotostelium fungivorum TaxID=1890364 RepID=A0A2P6NVA6_9EUKA|nr:hypothetical protein PROFUN_02639 [Planoprotostelium fungivorum]